MFWILNEKPPKKNRNLSFTGVRYSLNLSHHLVQLVRHVKALEALVVGRLDFRQQLTVHVTAQSVGDRDHGQPSLVDVFDYAGLVRDLPHVPVERGAVRNPGRQQLVDDHPAPQPERLLVRPVPEQVVTPVQGGAHVQRLGPMRGENRRRRP